MSILDIFQDRKGEVLFLFMTDKEKCLWLLKKKNVQVSNRIRFDEKY